MDSEEEENRMGLERKWRKMRRVMKQSSQAHQLIKRLLSVSGNSDKS